MAANIRRRLARSNLAPALSLGLRAQYLTKTEGRRISSGAKWLFGTHEHSNFTYDLTARSWSYMAAFVAAVSGCRMTEAINYLTEIIRDPELKEHVASATTESDRRRIADGSAQIGRRAGWYALVRAMQPDHVVETGTDKGLGSIVLASALLRNGHGRLTTIDVNEESGFLISGSYQTVIDRRIGSSLGILPSLGPVDVFIHDSNHDPAFERAEFDAVEPCLTPSALVLTDNSQASTSLFEWSLERDRSFLDFREEPVVAALIPEGIGASWRR